mgnify:CR=1 FL=1
MIANRDRVPQNVLKRGANLRRTSVSYSKHREWRRATHLGRYAQVAAMEPIVPQAGTIALARALAVSGLELAVAQARKRGPQGT